MFNLKDFGGKIKVHVCMEREYTNRTQTKGSLSATTKDKKMDRIGTPSIYTKM